MKVTAVSPTRIDFCGGTLDLWPISCLLDRCATVNLGVGVRASASIELGETNKIHITSVDQNLQTSFDFAGWRQDSTLPLASLLVGALWQKEWPGITMSLRAESPAGAGLGGSSSLGITIAKALDTMRSRNFETIPLSDHQLVAVVQDVEARLIHAPTGCQDYWGALNGGLNLIRYPFGQVDVQKRSTLPPRMDDLILCYSGASRQSAINNWEIFKRVFDGDKDLLSRLTELGEISATCADAIESNDWDHAFEAARQEWECRKALWPAVETIETKRQCDIAERHGAYLARVCGAGGGGVQAFFLPKENHAAVIEELKAAGGAILDGGASPQGTSIEIH